MTKRTKDGNSSRGKSNTTSRQWLRDLAFWRKRIQRSGKLLRAHQALLRSMDEGFCIVEVLFDELGEPVDYRFLGVNPSFERQTGIENAVGKTMREIAPGQEERWFETFARVALTGEPERFEDHAAQFQRWYDVYAFRVDETRRRHVAIIFNDITERKRGEEALRRSDQRLQRAMETDAVGMLFFNYDGVVVGANAVFLHMTGYTREQIDRRELTWRKMTPPEWIAVSEEQMERFAQAGRIGPYEKEYFLADGSRCWMLFAGRDMGDGTIVEYCIDISDHKRTEDALRQSEEKLHWAAELNAFRVKLNDALSPLNDPLQILKEAMRVMGEELQVDRVMYAEVDEEQGCYSISENYVRGDTPKILGRYSLGELGSVSKTLRQGELMVINDVRSTPVLKKKERANFLSAGITATLGVPLIKEGRWVGNFGIQHNTPREWTISETALVQETAERVWEAMERARAEEALRQSEMRYRILHESLRDAFVQVDMKGHVIYFNDLYCQMLGYSREEIMRLTYRDLTPVRWHAFEEKIVREQVLPRGFSDVYEKEYKRKDGTVFPVELRTILARDPQGNPNAMWAIIRDISDRKRSEEALRESDARIQKALSIETVGVLFFQLDGQITDANDAFLKMSGYSREELLQLNDWTELTPPDFQEVTSRAASELAATGETVPFEKQMVRKDGSRWWGLFAPTRLSAAGPLSECVEFIIDIGERKQFEEALRRNERQLQLLNESLEQKVEEKTSELRQLASELTRAEQRERNRISHILHDDLQQRIYAIQMQLSFLREELRGENDAARREVSNIDKELGDVLNIARNLSIELNPPILRGEGLTQAIAWLASKMNQHYGLPIEIQADESYTIPDEELHVLLFNCVRELLFNVVKHAQASRAVVALQRTDDGLRIEVRDDGRGLPSRELVEEDAGEEDELKASFGLSTIRRQLSLYGGSLEIYSQPGEGMMVLLTVPGVQAG